jgi:hypothetical protein
VFRVTAKLTEVSVGSAITEMEMKKRCKKLLLMELFCGSWVQNKIQTQQYLQREINTKKTNHDFRYRTNRLLIKRKAVEF